MRWRVWMILERKFIQNQAELFNSSTVPLWISVLTAWNRWRIVPKPVFLCLCKSSWTLWYSCCPVDCPRRTPWSRSLTVPQLGRDTASNLSQFAFRIFTLDLNMYHTYNWHNPNWPNTWSKKHNCTLKKKLRTSRRTLRSPCHVWFSSTFSESGL